MIYVSKKDKSDYYNGKFGGMLTEDFKGKVIKKEIKFPKELGEEHPFDFQKVEDTLKNFGLLNAAVDKYVDAVVGDFTVEAKNENVQAIIDNFVNDTDFVSHLRDWVREAIHKGNGFMELDLDDSKIRALNAKGMFVERSDEGEVEGYNQWIQEKTMSKKLDIVPFDKEKIAHLPINRIAGDAYGQGFVNPNMTTINLLMGGELDLHQIMKRKAGMPIIAKIGTPEAPATKGDMDEMNGLLQFMTNKTEWVINEAMDLSVLDFKDVGKNSMNLSDHDVQMLAMGMQIPMVLLGIANIPEGLAKVQLESFQRNIVSIQSDIEKIIEEKIFKPLLEAQGVELSDQVEKTIDGKPIGFSEQVKFKWNLPGETEINRRLERVEKMLGGMVQIGENLRRMLEKEYARLMGFEEDQINMLRDPEDGLDDQKEEEEKEEKQAAIDAKNQKPTPSSNPDQPKGNTERKTEENIPQPEVPGAKPNANQSHHMHGEGCGQQLSETDTSDLTVQEWVSLNEFENFNYSDYVIEVLKQVKRDEFSLLLATTQQQLEEGLLPPSEIEKLRIILSDGFKKNQTIKQIEKQIRDNVQLNDRLKDGKITSKAESRPNALARTETVRLANQGLLNHYKINNVERVRFLAALSERTCPICEELNGTVFTMAESGGIIPVHSMCRCSWVPLIE